jgi:hypothetical protein
MTTKIVIGGREYKSRDELPVALREHYDRAISLLADKDGNGVPDILEGAMDTPKLAAGVPPVAVYSHRIVFNGREYGSLEELPADVRRQVSDQVATTLARANPLEGLPPASPMLTFSVSDANGNRLFTVTSLALVFGGILMGLVIAMAVILSMGGMR